MSKKVKSNKKIGLFTKFKFVTMQSLNNDKTFHLPRFSYKFFDTGTTRVRLGGEWLKGGLGRSRDCVRGVPYKRRRYFLVSLPPLMGIPENHFIPIFTSFANT